MIIRRLPVLALALAAATCAARAQSQAWQLEPNTPASTNSEGPRSAEQSSFYSRTPRYELCPSDVFDIAFPYAPEFNQTLTIQPDGYITLREIGDVYVAGKTVPQLTQDLKAAYGRILHDPVLAITLKDFNKPYFTVGGQVDKPGRFELRADTTVAEAIAMAGGFTERAKHSQVLLVRKLSSEWAEVKKLDVKTIYKGDLREDVHLRSGDMLYVPKNTISKIKPFLPVYGLYSTLARY